VTTSLAVLLACGGEPPEPPAPEPTPIVSPDLGLTLLGLPEGLAVEAAGATGVVLSPSGAARQGRLEIGVERPTGAVNLVAAIQLHQAEIENRPEAEYKGSQELVTPTGPAFWSRGRYQTEDGGLVEETAIFALHPTAHDLMLKLLYTYPAGDDSSARVEELLAVLGEIEAG
jgi:hypothetical protein